MRLHEGGGGEGGGDGGGGGGGGGECEYDGSCPGELSVVTEPIYRVKLSISRAISCAADFFGYELYNGHSSCAYCKRNVAISSILLCSLCTLCLSENVQEYIVQRCAYKHTALTMTELRPAFFAAPLLSS